MKSRLTRAIPTLVILILGLSTTAQELFMWNRDTTYNQWHSIVLGSLEAEVGSNYLDNYFVDRLALGGKILNEEIDEAANDINGSGRFGAYGMGAIELYVLSDSVFGNPNLGYTAAIGERLDFYSYVSEDAFRLAFQGNADYAGKTAEFTNLNTSYYSWSKIGFGIFNKSNWSYLRMNLLVGNAMARSRANGTFYTSQMGDSLELNYSLDAQRNTGAPRFTAGLGAGIDGAMRFPLENDKGWVGISAQDVGFMVWNRDTEQYTELNRTYSFSGVDIPDILDLDNNPIEFPNLGDTLITDTLSGSEFIWLSPTIDFNLWRSIPGDHYYKVGMRVKPLQGYFPELSAAYVHAVTPNIYVSIDARYGGYRGFRLGAGLETLFSGPRTWYGGIKVSDVPGMFLDSQKGRAVWLSIGHIFTQRKS